MANVNFQELYKGSMLPDGRPGGILMEMHRSGRSITQHQRVRWHRNRLMYLGEQYLRIVGSTVRTLAPTDRIDRKSVV